jgi:hypothetical protein
MSERRDPIFDFLSFEVTGSTEDRERVFADSSAATALSLQLVGSRQFAPGTAAGTDDIFLSLKPGRFAVESHLVNPKL